MEDKVILFTKEEVKVLNNFFENHLMRVVKGNYFSSLKDLDILIHVYDKIKDLTNSDDFIENNIDMSSLTKTLDE